MSVDPRIAKAIREAVDDARQPGTVADRLLAWFEGIAEGKERLEDPDAVERRLELLFEATVAHNANHEKGDA